MPKEETVQAEIPIYIYIYIYIHMFRAVYVHADTLRCIIHLITVL